MREESAEGSREGGREGGGKETGREDGGYVVLGKERGVREREFNPEAEADNLGRITLTHRDTHTPPHTHTHCDTNTHTHTLTLSLSLSLSLSHTQCKPEGGEADHSGRILRATAREARFLLPLQGWQIAGAEN